MNLLNSPRLPAVFVALALIGFAVGGCDPNLGDDDDTTPDGSTGRVSVQPGGMLYETIQEALDAAPEGATVVPQAGTYEESLDITKPVVLSGASPNSVVVTGAGAGTMVEVDLVDGLVQISGMSFIAPVSELGTIRGIGITSSTNVVLHDLIIGFDDLGNGECDSGLSGVDASQSTVTLSESTIQCVGFENESGGTGLLVQTDSVVQVLDSNILQAGSFGIRAIDSSLSVTGSLVSTVNRPEGAESYEADGTGIFVEASNEPITVTNTIVTNGSFVGLWVESPTLSVTGSTFQSFAYGIYHPGDTAMAAGRTLTVQDSVFVDLAQEAILAISSATITGSSFTTVSTVPDPDGGMSYGGARVIAPLGTVSISDNVFDNLGIRGVGVYGNDDGNVASITVADNQISNIISGRGVDIQTADYAMISGNTISTIDHAYFTDDGGSGAGAIADGFGISCFYVSNSHSPGQPACVTEGNSITGAEFANLLFVQSTFSSTDDVCEGGFYTGSQVETSSGSFTNTQFLNQMGDGLILMDSTVTGTGVVISGTKRGPYYFDMDGVDDPLPEELEYNNGGRGLETRTTDDDADSSLDWSGGTFQDNIAGAVYSRNSDLNFHDNTLTNNGYTDEDSIFGPGSAIVVSGADDGDVSIQDNVVDQNEGSWAISLSGAPGATVSGNTLCGGTSAGMYVSGSDGLTVSDNNFGSSSDSTVTGCSGLAWNYALYLHQHDPTEVIDGVTVADNTFQADSMAYGVQIYGMGPYVFDGNTFAGATTYAINANLTQPTGLTSDNDGDGESESTGDCDDTDDTVGGTLATEVAGDGLDNDCDGVADDGTDTSDADGDSYSIADGDCNDTDAAINPGAVELLGNFFDDNCDGTADFDAGLLKPELTLTGNTVTGSGGGVRLSGASLVTVTEAVEAPAEPALNSFTDLGGTTFYLSTWFSTTGSVGSEMTLDSDVVIDGAAADCVYVVGADSWVDLGGATLKSCTNAGVRMTSSGTVTGSGGSIEDGGAYGVYASAGSLILSDMTISSVGSGGSAMQMMGGSLTGTNLQVSNSLASGYYIAGGAVSLTGGSVVDSTNTGIRVTAGSLTATDLVIDGSGTDGLYVTGGTATLSGGSISNVNSDGVDASGGTVVLDEVDIQSSDDDGISLSGTADAEVIDSSVFDNGAYGLRCNGGAADPGVSTVSLELCSFTSSGNSLGALLMTNGCELDWSCTVDGDDDDSSAGDDDDSSAGDDDDSAVGDDDDSAAGDDDSAAGDDDDSGN